MKSPVPKIKVGSRGSKLALVQVDEELIETFRGMESLPFESGNNRKIAVKIIDNRGIESFVVKGLE